MTRKKFPFHSLPVIYQRISFRKFSFTRTRVDNRPSPTLFSHRFKSFLSCQSFSLSRQKFSVPRPFFRVTNSPVNLNKSILSQAKRRDSERERFRSTIPGLCFVAARYRADLRRALSCQRRDIWISFPSRILCPFVPPLTFLLLDIIFRVR